MYYNIQGIAEQSIAYYSIVYKWHNKVSVKI